MHHRGRYFSAVQYLSASISLFILLTILCICSMITYLHRKSNWWFKNEELICFSIVESILYIYIYIYKWIIPHIYVESVGVEICRIMSIGYAISWSIYAIQQVLQIFQASDIIICITFHWDGKETHLRSILRSWVIYFISISDRFCKTWLAIRS